MPERESKCTRPQSAPPPPTPPARREVSPMLRESFLAIFQQEGQAPALRLLGELVYQLACESRGGYLMAKDDEDDAFTRADVFGAVGDLRQAAEQLQEGAKALAEIGSERREVMRVALAVADASAAVQPIADQLDAALAVYLASVAPEEPQHAAKDHPFVAAASLFAALRSEMAASLASCRKGLAAFAADLPDARDDDALAELKRFVRGMADSESWDGDELLQLLDSYGVVSAAELEQRMRQQAAEVRS